MQRRTFLTGVAVAASATAASLVDGAARVDAVGPRAAGGATDADEEQTASRPAVVGRSFSPTDECVGPGTAAVWVTDGGVSLLGGLRGPTGCSEPAIEDVRYRVADDTLTVVVGTEEAAETCTQALTRLAYRLELRFSGGLPGTVVVVHDGADGRREVARERIGSA